MNFLRRVFGGGDKAEKGKEKVKAEKPAKAAEKAEKAEKAAEPKAKEAKQEKKEKPAKAAAPAAAAPDSPKEEKKKKDSPKAAAPAASSSSSSSSPSGGDAAETLKVDKDLHCYIIGPKGATIKQLQADTGARIEVPKDGSDKVTITGSAEAVAQAKAEIKKIVDEQSARKAAIVTPEEAEEQSQRNEEAYQAAKKNVDKHAQLRDKYFKEAEEAYAAGDKDKARELREKAKGETAKMEEAQDKAAREVFDKVNKGKGITAIDLHGQQVKPAMKLLEERLATLAAKHPDVKELSVITGAGNHSGKEGPKIKPAVEKYFQEHSMTYRHEKNGELVLTL